MSDRIIPEAFALQGGLDLVSPALSLAPGVLIGCVNYEPDISGGYRRIGGIERLDGRSRPSEAAYTVLSVTVSGTIAVGNTVTGVTSAATAVVLQINTDELIVSKVSGAFTVGETLNIGGSPVAAVTRIALNGATTPSLHATYKNIAADLYRADIQAVPGSGPVRGVWLYDDEIYAFRDNAGRTAVVMHKATASGWSAITLGYQASVSLWHTIPPDGTAITGHSSGATTTVRRAFARTGVLGSTAVGTLFCDAPTGTFTASELMRASTGSTASTPIASPGVVTQTAHGHAAGQGVIFTGGTLPTGLVAGTVYYVLATGLGTNTYQVAATPGGTAINFTGTDTPTHTAYRAYGLIDANPNQLTFPAGGRYEFANYSFAGSSDAQRMYFISGTQSCCEWDGTTLVKIRSGMTNDKPSHLEIHQNQLFLSFSASVQASSIANPYAWNILTGAAELGVGGSVTNLISQTGAFSNGSATGALQVTTDKSIHTLYGTSVNWSLQVTSPNTGAYAHTAQALGNVFYLDPKGIMNLSTTSAFGDFITGTMSQLIQPFIDSKRGLAVASCVVRGKSQYRVFFSDGTGIAMYMRGTKLGGFTPFDYGDRTFLCVESCVMADGTERILAAGNDGYVYELDCGTSFDGDSIRSHAFLAFNSNKSPRVSKRYRRSVLQVTCDNTADVRVGYELDFGSALKRSGYRDLTEMIGSGDYWDLLVWGDFNWGAPYVTEHTIDTPGNGRNIGLLIYGDSDENEPYTLHSAIVHFFAGRAER